MSPYSGERVPAGHHDCVGVEVGGYAVVEGQLAYADRQADGQAEPPEPRVVDGDRRAEFGVLDDQPGDPYGDNDDDCSF
jgi:hypothetical protein